MLLGQAAAAFDSTSAYSTAPSAPTTELYLSTSGSSSPAVGVLFFSNVPGVFSYTVPTLRLRSGASPLSFHVVSADPSIASTPSASFSVAPNGSAYVQVPVRLGNPGTIQLSVQMDQPGRVPTLIPLTVNVNSSTPVTSEITLGKDLEAQINVYNATLTSSDPTRLLVSGDPATAGAATFTADQPASTFFLQALSDSGDVTVTATGSSPTQTYLVHLAPSGFLWTPTHASVTLNGQP